MTLRVKAVTVVTNCSFCTLICINAQVFALTVSSRVVCVKSQHTNKHDKPSKCTKTTAAAPTLSQQRRRADTKNGQTQIHSANKSRAHSLSLYRCRLQFTAFMHRADRADVTRIYTARLLDLVCICILFIPCALQTDESRIAADGTHTQIDFGRGEIRVNSIARRVAWERTRTISPAGGHISHNYIFLLTAHVKVIGEPQRSWKLDTCVLAQSHLSLSCARWI